MAGYLRLSLLVFVLGSTSSTQWSDLRDESFMFSNKRSEKIVDESREKRNSTSLVRESCRNAEVSPSHRTDTSDRLRRLRFRMKENNYDAYFVPSDDDHQSTYVANHDKRREFITGFTGSAGTAVILQDVATLWTDGRYYVQAEFELDCNWLLMKRHGSETPTVESWLVKKLKPGSRVGASAKVLSYEKWMYFSKQLEKFNIQLLQDGGNLIDDIWGIAQGRIPESVAHIFIHDIKYTGKSWQEKVEKLRYMLHTKQVDAIIITALDEIAWLLNLRESKSFYIPTFKAYLFVSHHKIRLYINPLKLTNEVRKYLSARDCNNSSCVEIKDYIETFEDLPKVISDTKKVLVSSKSSFAIVNLVPKKQRVIVDGPTPVSLLRVVKNPVEINGMKNACLKDAVAIVDFIAMLEEEVKNGKHWDEIKASKMLTKYRLEQELNRGESFATISAFGPNAAVIHYKPKVSTNRNINTKNMYLLDSGGQYLDGTTDITRTFHFGEPTEFQKETYTRVLIGVINLITAVFPDGVKGTDLDILARLPLYNIGLNYLHGTSHGIGVYLNVHEGPIGADNGFALKPGMIMSNEPGFYKTEEFGVRLETVMMVTKAHTNYRIMEMESYTFEPMAFVPFEPNLINFNLLNQKQIEWLNWYNSKTRNTVGVELRYQKRERGFKWLLSKTEHIPVLDCTSNGVSIHHLYLEMILLLCSFIFGSCWL